MADTSAGIDIIIAKPSADQLLHHEDFFIGAARGGNAAHRITPISGLNPLEFIRRMDEGLIPCDLAPGIGDFGADHRLGDAVFVSGIAIGKAPLDTGMAFIGLSILIGHHADNTLALHFRLEGTADAAIGAGGHHRMFRLAIFDNAFLGQGCGRAGLHTSAARHAFRA